MAAVRKVWVCEKLSRSGHRWQVWFTHEKRSAVHRNMRVSRGIYPKETFRTVPYTAGKELKSRKRLGTGQ